MLIATLILSIVLLILLIITFFAFALYICAVLSFSGLTPPFVPTSRKLRSLIADTLKVLPGSVVYDLGAGDMRIILAAWKQEPNATYIGIDKHLWPRLLAKFNIWRAGAKKNVSIREADLYKADLRDATRVYCYLFPEAMAALLPKLQKELRPGSIVVSLDFAMKEKEPEKTIDLKPYKLRLGTTLYVYRF